jgi:hypothetical protein
MHIVKMLFLLNRLVRLDRTMMAIIRAMKRTAKAINLLLYAGSGKQQNRLKVNESLNRSL